MQEGEVSGLHSYAKRLRIKYMRLKPDCVCMHFEICMAMVYSAVDMNIYMTSPVHTKNVRY